MITVGIAHDGWYPLGDVSLLHPDLIGMSMHQNAYRWFMPLHTWLEETPRKCNVTHRPSHVTYTCARLNAQVISIKRLIHFGLKHQKLVDKECLNVDRVILVKK